MSLATLYRFPRPPADPGDLTDHESASFGSTSLSSTFIRLLDDAAAGDASSGHAVGDPRDLGWGALEAIDPDERDALLTLLAIYDLWTAPLTETGGRERYQNHPAVSALKWRLEANFVDRLRARTRPVDPLDDPRIEDPAIEDPAIDVAAALRRVAARDLVPAVYEWLANAATWPELVDFVALEGGPDADFDDLVALVQVGISGDPKVALAANYWDEMGRGDLSAVHTVLHERLVEAIAMPRLARADLPVSALERKALSGLLITNRRLQPEALGALGLIEMQAGPRCRAVVKALERLAAPEGAFPFYEEHAVADPRHGKEWLDRVAVPLGEDPVWAARIVEGASWRDTVNRRFFADAHERFAGTQPIVRTG